MLRELIAHLGADFVIALAVMTVGGGKATEVGDGLEVPNEDMGGHVTKLSRFLFDLLVGRNVSDRATRR